MRTATAVIWRTVVCAGAMLAAPGCPHRTSTCVEAPAPVSSPPAGEPAGEAAGPVEPAPADGAWTTITVRSSTPDADVYADGVYQGKAPVIIHVPGGEREVTIRVTRDGYGTTERQVSASRSSVVDVDLTTVAARPRCTQEGKHGRGFVLS